MNEINLNALGRSSGIDKALGSAGPHKNVSQNNASVGSDSVQISKLPDLSQAEEALEEEFAALRAKFEEMTKSAAYPPLETIDRLARMLAVGEPKE